MVDVTPGDTEGQVGRVPMAPTARILLAALSASALVTWCGWASGFRRSTAPAEATWVVSLLLVVAADFLAWQGRRGRRPGLHLEPVEQSWPGAGQKSAVLIGLSPWLALSVLVIAWEVLGIDTGRHEPHLTISALTQAFRPLNAAMLLVWILVGLGYGAARARAPGMAARHASGPDRKGSRSAAALVLSHHSATMPALLALPALLLPANRGVGVAFWIAVVVAAIGIELAAHRSRGRIASAEAVVRYLTGSPVGNIVTIAAWAFAGYHLFAR